MGWKDTNHEWRVHPHGEWIELGEHAWAVRGELPDMPLGRWMVVARQLDGRLVIHNAMPLDDASMSAWIPGERSDESSCPTGGIDWIRLRLPPAIPKRGSTVLQERLSAFHR